MAASTNFNIICITSNPHFFHATQQWGFQFWHQISAKVKIWAKISQNTMQWAIILVIIVIHEHSASLQSDSDEQSVISLQGAKGVWILKKKCWRGFINLHSKWSMETVRVALWSNLVLQNRKWWIILFSSPARCR